MRKPQLLRSCAALGLALGLPLVLGCGASKGTVSGKVTIKGEPLTWGTIYFVGKDPQSAEVRNGVYKMENIPTGDYKIKVESRAKPKSLPTDVKIGSMPAMPNMGGDKGPGAPPMLQSETQQKTPPPEGPDMRVNSRYLDPDKSGLKCRVEGGNQPGVDFDLEP
jgi:hypothetical protein